jgi:hypothetical protein
MLSLYTDIDERTPISLAPYTDVEERTVDVEMTKSDAVYAAHECSRLENYEAAGVWLLVAGGL